MYFEKIKILYKYLEHEICFYVDIFQLTKWILNWLMLTTFALEITELRKKNN